MRMRSSSVAVAGGGRQIKWIIKINENSYAVSTVAEFHCQYIAEWFNVELRNIYYAYIISTYQAICLPHSNAQFNHHPPPTSPITLYPAPTYHPPREPSGGVDIHNQFIDTQQQRHCVDIKIVCRMLTICALSAANLILCPDSIHTAQA